METVGIVFGFTVVSFVVGFFVGRKNGEKVVNLAKKELQVATDKLNSVHQSVVDTVNSAQSKVKSDVSTAKAAVDKVEDKVTNSKK